MKNSIYRNTSIVMLAIVGMIVSVSSCTKDQGPIIVPEEDTTSVPDGPTVSFKNDVEPLFQFGTNPQCTSCHPPSGELNLITDSAYSNLVNVPTYSFSGAYTLVVPFDTTNSVLWDKINGYGNYGMGMPPPVGGGYSPEALDIISTWIMEGALDN